MLDEQGLTVKDSEQGRMGRHFTPMYEQSMCQMSIGSAVPISLTINFCAFSVDLGDKIHVTKMYTVLNVKHFIHFNLN
jgi:hypothetical protein